MHTHITSALLGWIYGICHQLSLEYDFISIAHFLKFVKGFFKFFLYIPEAVRHDSDRSRSVLFCQTGFNVSGKKRIVFRT